MKAAHEFICDLAEKISMPEVYLAIRNLMSNPNTRVSDFVSIVETDPMLAIRIIRIANSEYFGFNRKADDLYDAISLIGAIQLHDLLLSSLCMRTFYNIPEQILNFRDFWRHGIKCGIAARSIARFCRLPASNRYFTLGLMLEIGHAAMFVKAPDLAISALLESQQNNQTLDQIERQHFGFDYCELGAAMMQQWKLPDVYLQIIEHQLNPDKCNPLFRTESQIVNLAQQFCQKPGGINPAPSKILVGHQQYKIIPEMLEEMIATEIAKNADQIFAMLRPPNPLALQ